MSPLRHAAMSDQTMASMVRHHAASTPNRPAVIDGNRTMTYCELDEAARRLVGGFTRQGLMRGDVVSVQLPNRLEFLLVAVAAAYGGYVFNPISARFRHAEMLHIIKLAGTKALVYADTYHGFDYRELGAQLRTEYDQLRCIVIGTPSSADETSFSELARGPSVSAADLAPIGLDEPGTILHSSGTEGRPKLVLHHERSFMHDTLAIAERSRLDRSDRFLAATPLNTGTGTHGMVHCALVLGAALVLLPNWDPAHAGRLIAEHGCTYTIAPATMLLDLLDDPSVTREDLRTLRLFTCGGMPIPHSVVTQAHDRMGFDVTPMYGASEMLAATCGFPGDSSAKVSQTDGRPLFGVDLGIVDDVGSFVDVGTAGEIVVRGPTLFRGYVGERAKTNAVLLDGWYHTGDVGILDHDGYVRVVDRKKDIIIRGGLNLSPKSIEAELLNHPAISTAAVVGMPDRRLGERIAAFVVTVPGAPKPQLEDVLHFLEQQGVAKTNWPEHLEVLDALPRNASGKVAKDVLRSRLKSA